MALVKEQQRDFCRDHGADFVPPAPGSKAGIALQTLDRLPIHGIRLPPTESTCGWYIYAGDEWADAADFYQPLCVEHLEIHCPAILPFLGLPPGWRFMTDAESFIEVWQGAEPNANPDPAL